MAVHGSLQCPYYVTRRSTVARSARDEKQVQVVQAETGGGFGGKEEYPSMIAVHAGAARSRPAAGRSG